MPHPLLLAGGALARCHNGVPMNYAAAAAILLMSEPWASELAWALLLTKSASQSEADSLNFSCLSCGKKGIRTPEPVLPVTRFPGVPLQPLEHLSRIMVHRFVETFLQI